MELMENISIIRLPQVIQLVGLRRTCIYDMMKMGTFPRAVALGARAVGWRLGDIRAWLQSRT